jgi:hypothetical protein
MEFDVGIDLDAIPELAIRAARDAWLEDLDASAAARPLSEVEVLALSRSSDVDELHLERGPP